MNSRSLLGRSLHMGNMRIVRSVAASFLKFLLAFLCQFGAVAPVFLIFIIVFTLGMAYADYTFINQLSELTSRSSELNHCATLFNEEFKNVTN